MSVGAQFFLKAGMSSERIRSALDRAELGKTILAIATEKGILIGFVLYGLGALIWLAVLTEWDVSKAYPMVGLGFVLTAVIGVMLGEHVSLARLAGVTLICCGVFLVGRT